MACVMILFTYVFVSFSQKLTPPFMRYLTPRHKLNNEPNYSSMGRVVSGLLDGFHYPLVIWPC